jgi:hypothetical protein
LLGEGNVLSNVGEDGFMIGGNKGSLKEGDINPLTGDKLKCKHFEDEDEYEDEDEEACFSESTAREIEVWKITFMD